MNNQLAEAQATFRANAKTFSLAARFLNRNRYEAVARLYAFCRHVDDLADTGNPGSNSATLNAIREDIRADKSATLTTYCYSKKNMISRRNYC